MGHLAGNKIIAYQVIQALLISLQRKIAPTLAHISRSNRFVSLLRPSFTGINIRRSRQIFLAELVMDVLPTT